jgi:hypothetical protein
VVAGLMACVAGSAQGEVGAHWNVIKATGELVQIPGANDLLPQLEFKEVENSTLTLLWATVGGTKVAVLCTTMKFDEGGRLIAEGSISLGRMLLTGCITLLNGTIAPTCKPKTAGKALGELLTEKFKGLIVLDKLATGEVDDFIKLVPDEGKILLSINFGEECPFETFKIEAKTAGEGFWLKDCGPEPNKSFLEEKVEHLFEESLRGLIALWQPLTIDGSFIMRLAGEHVGLKWGGTPG